MKKYFRAKIQNECIKNNNVCLGAFLTQNKEIYTYLERKLNCAPPPYSECNSHIDWFLKSLTMYVFTL